MQKPEKSWIDSLAENEKFDIHFGYLLGKAFLHMLQLGH